MANTNYGTVLKKATTVVGDIVKMTSPKITSGSVETTHATSGGRKTFIPDGLVTIEPFKVTIYTDVATLALLEADMLASTVATYTVDYTSGSGLTDRTFSAFVQEIKSSKADAQNPNAQTVEVMFGIGGFGSFDIV
jgi:hypothetical protein